MTTFAERFHQARTASGASRQEIADVLGISYQSVAEWETKSTRPRAERLEKVAEFLGVSAAWLATGEGMQPSQRIAAYTPGSDIPAGFSAIKEYRLELRAHGGPCAEPEWEELTEVTPCLYPDSFFQKHHTTPSRCKRARVYGDSMEPFIFDNDRVTWIEEPCPEVGCVHIIDGAVYVISIDGAMKIKRLQTCKDGITVISDNEKRYPPETYTGDECNRIRIYGRVIELNRTL